MSSGFFRSDSSETVDLRMVAMMRLVLAASALLITYIDPSEPNRFVFATYLALILYTFYSALLYFLVVRENKLIQPFVNFSHWADVVWYLILIALSSGTSSIFFFFFFFAILFASFTWGFISGLKVTLVSAVAFTIIGYATAPSGADFELNRFLLRPIYLTVLGYMMSYWGGWEIRTKRRLALLREIAILSNPRFGVDRTIGVILELLRKFYDADGCLLIMTDTETDEYVFRRAERSSAEAAFEPYQLNPRLMQRFLALPKNSAVIYDKNSSDFPRRKVRFYTLDLKKGETSTENQEMYDIIAEKLDTHSFLSVPVYHRKEVVGRIFIFTSETEKFDKSDIDFLLQAIDQFMPVIENVRLVDRLASSAAEEERKRIARDIHDSIIQPYIGLQYGLDSVEHLLETESEDRSFQEKENLIKRRIRKLKELTERGIEDLRNYTRGLIETGQHEGSLLPSIERFAEKFTSATGITVEINSQGNIQIADRLAAELFQIVAEGLSNIRKHTQSPGATIGLHLKSDKIFLTIENIREVNENADFKPVSISERVKSLGGFLEIKQEAKKTILSIEIPL